jgi:DNA-binding transcriptional ArsR family regulator
MGEEESPRKPISLEEISRKLDLVMSKLNLLEQIVLEDPKYADSIGSIRLIRMFLSLYDEPLKVLSRLKIAESYARRDFIAKDEISRCIIQALAVKGKLSISAITREVRAMRGKASRRIVRERLKILEKHNIVKKTEHGNLYCLIEPAE